MSSVAKMPKITLNEFEKFHRPKQRPASPKITLKEIGLTILITLIGLPFFLTTFFVIPMMGQVTVGLVALVTTLYLYFRRSVVILGIIAISVAIPSVTFLAVIPTVKNQMDLTLFILTALGIPVCAMYCMFIGTRIWDLLGGGE